MVTYVKLLFIKLQPLDFQGRHVQQWTSTNCFFFAAPIARDTPNTGSRATPYRASPLPIHQLP